MDKIENKQFSTYYGLGGWLGWIQFWQIASIFIIIIREALTIVRFNLSFSEVAYVFFGTLLGVLTLLNVGLLVTSFVFLRLRSMLFRTFYLTTLGVVYIINLVSAINGFTNWGYVIGYMLGSTLWIVYLFKSERVKNTLRKIGEDKTEYEMYLEFREQENQNTQESATV